VREVGFKKILHHLQVGIFLVDVHLVAEQVGVYFCKRKGSVHLLGVYWTMAWSATGRVIGRNSHQRKVRTVTSVRSKTVSELGKPQHVPCNLNTNPSTSPHPMGPHTLTICPACRAADSCVWVSTPGETPNAVAVSKTSRSQTTSCN
jgi:hypothetical protein